MLYFKSNLHCDVHGLTTLLYRTDYSDKSGFSLSITLHT